MPFNIPEAGRFSNNLFDDLTRISKIDDDYLE